MNLDEAMYTFGTGENFHLQNYLGVHELEEKKDLSSVCGPLMLSRFR